MSGSSCDGLDICYSAISLSSRKPNTGRSWEFEIEQALFVPFPDDLRDRLKIAAQLSVPEFLKLDIDFARFCGAEINKFIEMGDLRHRLAFIVSHGHTVWHEPAAGISTQIGDGATIAAITGFSTFCNLRNMDVAFGGQGAPIVPLADQLLFSDYDFCLNLGGIANVTINRESNPLAFDVCPANQLLDYFAAKKGLAYDRNGDLARSGHVNQDLLSLLDQEEYYHQKNPKSLSNQFSIERIIPVLENEAVPNALATAVQHIVEQLVKSMSEYCKEKEMYRLLVTGGGALNGFLIESLKAELARLSLPIVCEVPDEKIIFYKEALAMSMLGILRWREEPNVLASVTGATQDSIGGAFWMGKN